MGKRRFTFPSSGMLIRLLFFVLLSTTVFLWSCEKAEETVQPGAKTFSAEQVRGIKSAKEKEDKDDKYKTDKTGQYVSKDVVQVMSYEDGSERPTRPKYDAAASLRHPIYFPQMSHVMVVAEVAPTHLQQ